MKKVYYTTKRGGSINQPFWSPWGKRSFFLRLLGFLLILCLAIFLLSLIHRCSRSGERCDVRDVPKQYQTPSDPSHTGDVEIDTIPSIDIPDIQDPNLPDQDDNRLRPVDDDDIVDDDDGVGKIVSNRLNVILNSDASDATFQQFAKEFKQIYPDSEYEILFYDTYTKLIQLGVPASQRAAVQQNLPKQITDIDFKIFTDDVMEPMQFGGFNDPVLSDSRFNWYLNAIQAFDAWKITQGNPNIIIAIVDSYFDLNHDELNSSRIVKPYSVARRTGNVAPDASLGEKDGEFYHGSFVASLAVGNANNGVGFAGIAPNCSLMPVSICTGKTITSMNMLQGILYSIYQGANVINISAGEMFSQAVARASIEDQVNMSKTTGLDQQDVWDYVFKLADERNVTIVWAAGNEDVYGGLDPSKRCDNTIRVAAVDKNLEKAEFSNYGNLPQYGVQSSTISAPGVELMGAKPYNSFTVGDGTSFSAPIVAGAVGLIKSIDPTLSNSEIIKLLQSTGKTLKGSPTIGPLLQIKDALLQLKTDFGEDFDLVSDHKQFVGLWQSVNLLRKVTFLSDGTVQATGDYNYVYFDIKSTSSGKVIIYEKTSTKYDFVAPLMISWKTDGARLIQPQDATCANSDEKYMKNTYWVTQDESGLLLCTQTDPAGRVLQYYLKKIQNRTY